MTWQNDNVQRSSRYYETIKGHLEERDGVWRPGFVVLCASEHGSEIAAVEFCFESLDWSELVFTKIDIKMVETLIDEIATMRKKGYSSGLSSTILTDVRDERCVTFSIVNGKGWMRVSEVSRYTEEHYPMATIGMLPATWEELTSKLLEMRKVMSALELVKR